MRLKVQPPNVAVLSHGVFQPANGPIIKPDPAIVCLDPVRVTRHLHLTEMARSALPRMEQLLDAWTASGQLLLPILSARPAVRGGLAIELVDGHHRTAAFAQFGWHSAPYLTERRMAADLLALFGASVATAQITFDLTDVAKLVIPYP